MAVKWWLFLMMIIYHYTFHYCDTVSFCYYPRKSDGLCFYRHWFVCLSVCLSVCLFVCLFVTTITK